MATRRLPVCFLLRASDATPFARVTVTFPAFGIPVGLAGPRRRVEHAQPISTRRSHRSHLTSAIVSPSLVTLSVRVWSPKSHIHARQARLSLELSALFALSIAEVRGVAIDEIERRTIVMGIMLGGSGSATISKVAERTGQHWGRQVVAKVPVETLRQINKLLGKNFVTKYGTKQGIIVLGRVAPFGIGAVVGGGANAANAALTVRAARRAFGPAPTS